MMLGRAPGRCSESVSTAPDSSLSAYNLAPTVQEPCCPEGPWDIPARMPPPLSQGLRSSRKQAPVHRRSWAGWQGPAAAHVFEQGTQRKEERSEWAVPQYRSSALFLPPGLPPTPGGFLGASDLLFPVSPALPSLSSMNEFPRTVRSGAPATGRVAGMGKGLQAGTDLVCRASHELGGWIRGAEGNSVKKGLRPDLRTWAQ